MAPELTDFIEFILDLPEGRRKLTIHKLTPLTDDDFFTIPRPAERTENSSVVGFLESGAGGKIAAPNFYVGGSGDRVSLINRADETVFIVTMSDTGRVNFIPKLEE